MWKPIIGISSHSQIAVSVPLRGLDMWKPADHPKFHPKKYCFSPLAGIRYVETRFRIILPLHPSPVSVPLRGLDMWKPRRLKHKLGAESRDDFGGPLKKPYFRLWVKHKLKLMKR